MWIEMCFEIKDFLNMDVKYVSVDWIQFSYFNAPYSFQGDGPNWSPCWVCTHFKEKEDIGELLQDHWGNQTKNNKLKPLSYSTT